MGILNLTTGNKIRRSNWKKMVTTQAVIDRMNAMTTVIIADEVPVTSVPDAVSTENLADQLDTPEQFAEPKAIPDVVNDAENEPQDAEPFIEDSEERAGAEQPVEQSIIEQEQVVPVRRSARIAQEITPPERYLLLTKIKEATDKAEGNKEQAKFAAIQKKILQIFEELEALVPVMKADVPEDAEVLRCFIFLVEKFLANGEFDKIKARLVANGAQQNRELYINKSSPTASIHAILTCFALVTYIGNYEVAKIDVKGAHIQTEITGSPIYMKMDKKLTTMVLSILPSLQSYVTPKGTLYTKLLKASYSCIQSGQLWYMKIAKVLRREGYIHQHQLIHVFLEG
jgi:hypothetical protein